MERLPTHYKGIEIVDRIPYNMRGELTVLVNVNGAQFPESTFMHNVDKPFEAHRMKIDLTAFDNQATPVAVVPTLHFSMGEYLGKGIRLTILDTSRNELLTKNPTLVEQILRKDTGQWEWEQPYYLEKSTNFLTTVDNIFPAAGFSTGTVGGVAAVVVGAIRVECNYQGYLIVLKNRVPA